MAAELNQHIAILFEFPSLYGGEHSILSVLVQLCADGVFQFTAIAPAEGVLAKRLDAIGIPIVPLSVRSASGVKRDASDLLTDLSRIVTSLQPDIVHANSLSMSRLLGQLCVQLPNQKFTGHVRDIMRLSRQAVADLNSLDRIAAVSEATREFHVAQGLDPKCADVVYNGVDTTRFRGRAGEYCRSDLLPELPPESVVLLNVGQICLRKGQLILAQAVTRLLKFRQDIHLVLVGERHSAKAESVAYEQAIVDEFAAAGLSTHLHRPGYSENVEHWMNAADLLVHTAHQEPLGRVLLEAAASELPIIATDVGGTSEILQDQYSARLLPPGDIGVLTECLRVSIEDPGSSRQFATAAVIQIWEVFGILRASEALGRFWQTVAKA